jgi:hypothetical protein
VRLDLVTCSPAVEPIGATWLVTTRLPLALAASSIATGRLSHRAAEQLGFGIYINKRGDVAGSSDAGGFFYSHGNLTTIHFPGSATNPRNPTISGINGRGQLAAAADVRAACSTGVAGGSKLFGGTHVDGGDTPTARLNEHRKKPGELKRRSRVRSVV